MAAFRKQKFNGLELNTKVFTYGYRALYVDRISVDVGRIDETEKATLSP